MAELRLRCKTKKPITRVKRLVPKSRLLEPLDKGLVNQVGHERIARFPQTVFGQMLQILIDGAVGERHYAWIG